MAVNIPIGAFPAMQWIQEDNQQLANAMQLLIQQGSFRNGVAIDDLRIFSADPAVTAFTSVAQAVEHGTRLFDAMLYFCIPVANRPPVDHNGAGSPDAERLPEFIAPRLFQLAFYLLTRGNVPVSNATTVGAIIPAILHNSFGMTYSPDALIASLASFNLRNLTNVWIRFINWAPMSQIARNRVALGVGGYRMITPFKMYTRQPTVQHNIAIGLAARDAAYDTARLLATREYDWNIHPITRSPVVIQSLGPLNPNLGNLMLACFDDNQLTQMNTLRMIYAVPTENLRYNNYKGWTPALISWVVDPIF